MKLRLFSWRCSTKVDHFLVRAVFVAVLVVALIQSTTGKATAASASTQGITVDEVIRLHKAGVSENVLVGRIKQVNRPLALSSDDILRLAEAKVPDRVVELLMDPSSAPAATQTVTNPTPVGDSHNPEVPHDSGIYLFSEKDNTKLMTPLEPAAYTGGKSGGMFTSAITYGIKKVKWKAIIQGPRAGIRSSDRRPIFYFYFEGKSAALGGGGLFGPSNITSPNQFTCVKLERKTSNRETVVSEVGAFGASSGTHEKSIIPFTSQRLRSGVYKVVFSQDLENGEYAFVVGSALGGTQMAGAAMPLQVFDFGVPSDK